MMIQVRKTDDGSYEIVNGHMRLKLALELQGRAEVVDIESQVPLLVHEVGGQLLALTKDAQETVETAAHAIVEKARVPRP